MNTTSIQSSLLQNKSIAIIGGGPVGLTLGRLLQLSGADVSVYERDAVPNSRTGGTLDIHAEDGQLALQAAGLDSRFRALARPTAERMADENGAILREEWPTEQNAFDRPEIDRADLNQLLLDSLLPGTVRWNHAFESLEECDGRFRLRFTQQSDRFADIVIGANGSRSKVRPYVTGAVPFYTGTSVIEGAIPDPHTHCPALAALVNDGNLIVRSEGKVLFCHTKANGSLEYYLSFRRSADWFSECGLTPQLQETAPVVQLLARELSNWHPMFHESFSATTQFTFLRITQVPLSPHREVTRPITLVGDAAHVMTPFAGIGVNMGLRGALTLATNLTGEQFPTIEAAIRDYEAVMFDYASRAQEESALSEIALHSEMSPEELVAATRQG